MQQLCRETLGNSSAPKQLCSSGRTSNWAAPKQLRPSVVNKSRAAKLRERDPEAGRAARLVNLQTALTTRNFGSSEIWLTYTQFLTLFYQMKNKFDNFHVKFCTILPNDSNKISAALGFDKFAALKRLYAIFSCRNSCRFYKFSISQL